MMLQVRSFVLVFIGVCFFITNGFSAPSPSKNDEKTVIQEQAIDQKQAALHPSIVSLYRPNYIMPFYHTGSPYQSVYVGNTPNNQKIQKDELKAQLSFLVPLVRTHIHRMPISLNTAYTQLMYWQVYAKSQYFRETNYEPELFLQTPINACSAVQLGVNHQSNGRGGLLERSWNRVYGQYAYSGVNWLFQVRGWALIAKADSSNLHNPRIAHFLGHENVLFSYDWRNFVGTVQVQNIESGLKRGFVQASLSYPVLPTLSVYGQFFNGYGQSLIEYNHKTTSFGIGIALNDWINK